MVVGSGCGVSLGDARMLCGCNVTKEKFVV